MECPVPGLTQGGRKVTLPSTSPYSDAIRRRGSRARLAKNMFANPPRKYALSSKPLWRRMATVCGKMQALTLLETDR